MHSPILMATQLTTPPQEHGANAIAPIVYFSLAAVCLVVFALGLLKLDMPTLPLGVLLAGGIGLSGLGIASAPDAEETDKPHVDVSATVDLVEETYDLTAVEASESDDPTVEGLCQSVSLDSPEFVGIADGQKVTFRVGVPDCDSPDPEIVITETTGRAIAVDELRSQK